MEHTFLTIAIPFDPARAAAVDKHLEPHGNPARKDLAEALDAGAVVHFMSINAIPGHEGGRAHLVIEASVDGGARAAAEHLVAVLSKILTRALEEAGIAPGATPLADFLLRHRVKVGTGWFSTPGLDFNGSPGMSVARIRRESALAKSIAEMLEREPPFATPRHALEFVRTKLWDDQAAKWAFVAEPTPMLQGKAEPWKQYGSIAWSAFTNLVWVLLIAPVLGFAGGWWLWTLGTAAWIATFIILAELAGLLLIYMLFRRLEESDVPEDIPPSRQRVEEMMKLESRAAQGLLAAVSIRKPGPIRRLSLRVGFWFAGLTRWLSRPGFLTHIGVIHFARWFMLPGTNQMMFFSNYDGAWESYLEDFIERGHRGVSGIWSNTIGFPKTRNLLTGGARDGDRLRRWTRRQMFPPRFWYTAYPHLTLTRIRANAAIRQGIASAATEAQAADWLACFGSAPRPPEVLEVSEIPTLVFGGLGKLRCGGALFVRFTDRARAKAWLAAIADRATFGHNPRTGTAAVVGLSHSGLKALDLSDEALTTFPLAFQDGSHAEWRARALGDVDGNDPSRWLWGNAQGPVDAVLALYATDAAFTGLVAEAEKEIAGLGHTIVHRIVFTPVPKERGLPKEAFGFVDGIGQPIIRGTNRDVGRETHHQSVAPGEFILGYPDNLGYVPPAPAVAAGTDPANLLPSVARPSGQRPNFAAPLPDGQHDLGRNGTFLVVRQLEQDVTSFKSFLVAAAAKLAGDARVPFTDSKQIEDWLAAKMVGRWQNGSSLVRHPSTPGSKKNGDPVQDNDFLPGAEDPSGMRCPLGAHIRRANPRESFDPGAMDQLAISNRHRIFRVGRSYQADGKQGIVFMCVNADIERQFEFVQQTWLMAPSFHGLESEVDATLNNRGGANCFTIPTPSGPLRVRGMRDFVSVKGGAYFFLPSRRALKYLARA